jgi:hypothetical protein
MKSTPATRAFAWSILAVLLLTALIAILAPRLASVPHLPDQGPAWYFWKLASPSFMSHLSAWLGYASHQISLWVVVVLMMKEKPHPGRLSKLNIAALGINLAFILLHILQTQLWYDGLAQDLPVWSSQYSVIIMLVIILYQLAPIRGLALGRKIRWKPEALRWSTKWHGLYISWALVYTFWFHPTEGQYGLLIGFFYMFLLLLQLSFANTEVHLSLGWITLLELLVGLHGPLIAIQKALSGNEGDPAGPGIWIMFATGFAFMFVFTGQFGLKIPRWGRALIFAAYAAAVIGLFAWRGFSRIYEVAFIPAALYGGAFALAGLARLASTIGRPRKKTRAAGPDIRSGL